jgi:hypothetical protein
MCPARVVGAQAAGVEVVDVPHGQHGFDALDHTDESREAVNRALDLVLDALTRPGLPIARQARRGFLN